ncbi:hypothetical protein ACTNES_09115 [Blautia sp. HCP3S3_D9]|uniref:hypothetical protein n=1 Tax=Blautia TaxID=572511 RepID=UPI00232D8D7D|nr:hypothetical protein [Blautia wexlerae]MDB6440986.1 hypothetical protein [Blautia wexlerae]
MAWQNPVKEMFILFEAGLDYFGRCAYNFDDFRMLFKFGNQVIRISMWKTGSEKKNITRTIDTLAK